jgi:hypothetical protein
MTNADKVADSLRESSEQTDSQDQSAALAWEMIEDGRYRPRRIRGSCQGRELG